MGDWGLTWFSWCGDGIPETCAAAILSSIKKKKKESKRAHSEFASQRKSFASEPGICIPR